MYDRVYWRRLGEFVGVGKLPTIELRPFQRAPFALTLVSRDAGGAMGPLARDDAYLICLQLRDLPEHPYRFDGRDMSMPTIPSGQFTIFDLRAEHSSYQNDPVCCLTFYVSRAALEGIASEESAARVSLNVAPIHRIDDAVVRGLGYSLVPALQRPERASRLFLDSVALAFLAHISQTYGGFRGDLRSRYGGLAPWQERRVKDALLAQVDGNISLKELADLAGLSRSHFARAFKVTAGVPPHQWLLARRVETAEELLLSTKLPIEDIAVRCGFSDQSHLTRVFSRMRGTSPGQWRRQRRD